MSARVSALNNVLLPTLGRPTIPMLRFTGYKPSGAAAGPIGRVLGWSAGPPRGDGSGHGRPAARLRAGALRGAAAARHSKVLTLERSRYGSLRECFLPS